MNIASQYFEWITLVVTVGLFASYFTLTSQRSRRCVFLSVCAIGIILAVYGYVRLLETGEFVLFYFQELGLTFSTIIVVTLCFAALTLDRTFSERELRKWIYPALSWYFAAWVGLSAIFALQPLFRVFVKLYMFAATVQMEFDPLRPLLISLLLGLLSSFLLLAAFISSAVWRFNLMFFRILFPFLAIVFAVGVLRESQGFTSLPESAEVSEAMRFMQSKGILGSGETQTVMGVYKFAESRLRGASQLERFRFAFFESAWALFLLLGYFYLNAKANIKRFKQNPLVRKLPNAGVVLAIASLVDKFPEYQRLRDWFPLGMEIFEYLMLALDMSLILTLSFLVAVGGLIERGSVLTSQGE